MFGNKELSCQIIALEKRVIADKTYEQSQRDVQSKVIGSLERNYNRLKQENQDFTRIVASQNEELAKLLKKLKKHVR